MKPSHLLALALVTNISSGWTSSGPQLESLSKATEWINSPPLTAKNLQGKVVLIDFWTYTCINWRRTLPYVRAWADKYKAQGLVVIGVHSPEFPFEKDPVVPMLSHPAAVAAVIIDAATKSASPGANHEQ